MAKAGRISKNYRKLEKHNHWFAKLNKLIIVIKRQIRKRINNKLNSFKNNSDWQKFLWW